MAQDIFDKISPDKKEKEDVFEKVAKAQSSPLSRYYADSPTITAFSGGGFKKGAPLPEGRGTIASFKRGFGSGVTGLATGATPQPAPEDEGWGEYLASITGGLVSDAPAFYAGGQAGAALGGLAGSVIPGAGTAGGAGIGATIGAFTLPSFIKSSFAEYRDFAQKGGDLTFGDFLERSGRIAKETGKAGVMGVAMAGAGRALPVIKRIPGLKKLMGTKLGAGAAEAGLEVGALTGTRSALEGKLPTAKEVVGDVFTVGALKGVHKGREAVKSFGRRKTVFKKPIAETKFGKAVKEFLPESVSRRLTSEARNNRAKWEEGLKDFVGSKNAKIVKSAFEWQENQAKYEKAGGKFTKKQLKEMMHYAQRTGNPEHGFEDSFTDVKGRLPKHAQNFVDDVIRPHLKESLKAWNENTATKNINPREGLEDYYLPGVYKKTSNSKIRAVDQKIRTKFKIKNPFSNPKEFMTYNEAAIEAGLEPRFDNIVDLMKHFDKVNIKTMHSAELVNMVRSHQQQTGDQVIVTADNTREYAKAQEKGYVPFEDPILRSYKTKDGEFKRTELPALVDPEFARSFKGVFTRDAFRPDGKFLKGLDFAKNQINAMRVMASPFHYFAIGESVLGARGLKGFRLMNMASEGRALRQSKDFMMDAAKHGLVVKKRLGITELKKGNLLLERGLDLIIDSDSPQIIKKGVAKFKRGMTYMFDEFIPNAKAVIYEEMSVREISKFKKEYKRAPTAQETKDIKRTIAEHTNNILGGQNWETSKYLRDPRMRKRVSRIFAFPDWTISAAKQASSAAYPGLKGRLGRRYRMKYMIYGSAAAAFLRSYFGGLEQTEDKGSLKGIKFNPEKAADAFKDVNSYKDLFSFSLPDTPIRYGSGKKQVFNPGRDEEGAKRKAHFGKQDLEVLEGWLQHPVATMYSKANPLFTTAYEQLRGSRPARGGSFKVQQEYFRGRKVPWEGKRGIAQALPRAKHLLGQIVPFAFRRGAKQWIATGFGSVPAAKEYTPFKAEDDIERTLLLKDKKKTKEALEGIRVVLRANNFPEKAIKGRISLVRNQMIKDGQLPKALNLKRAEPLIDKLLQANDVQGLNKLKKELMEDAGYTARGVNNKISSRRKKLKIEKK